MSDSEKDLAEIFETILVVMETSRTAGPQGHAACSQRRRVETGAVPTQLAGPYNAPRAATTAKHRAEVFIPFAFDDQQKRSRRLFLFRCAFL